MHVRAYAGYAALPPELKPWAFDLTRRNMRDMYERTWGWWGLGPGRRCLLPATTSSSPFFAFNLELNGIT